MRTAPWSATLSFVHTHTRRAADDARTAPAGDYVAPALNDINVLLRDFRANAVKPIDPALLDLLFQLNDAARAPISRST